MCFVCFNGSFLQSYWEFYFTVYCQIGLFSKSEELSLEPQQLTILGNVTYVTSNTKKNIFVFNMSPIPYMHAFNALNTDGINIAKPTFPVRCIINLDYSLSGNNWAKDIKINSRLLVTGFGLRVARKSSMSQSQVTYTKLLVHDVFFTGDANLSPNVAT